ncbi:MAG: hypothetical protein ACTHK7_15030 [Aureliella sp.]
MTQFAFEQPPEDDGSSSSFLSKPGFFHVVVMAQDPQPMSFDKSKYLDGLDVTFGVLAGTHPDQFDKTFDQLFLKGNAEQRDGGKFCNRRLLKLFLATGMMGQHVPGQQTQLDTAAMVGRQLVIEVEERPNGPQAKNPNGKHIELKFDCLYHVDDPAVKDVPKHPQFFAAIPAELRRDKSTFAKPDDPAQPATRSDKPKLSVAAMMQAQAPNNAPSANTDDV